MHFDIDGRIKRLQTLQEGFLAEARLLLHSDLDNVKPYDKQQYIFSINEVLSRLKRAEERLESMKGGEPPREEKGQKPMGT